MEVYTKETIKQVTNTIDGKNYYLPKALFEGKEYGLVRLETKMAYVAILDTLLKKPTYSKEGVALLKTDNPEIIHTLAVLANKKVDQEKMNRYFEELVEANLITIDKKDLFVINIG